MSLTGVVSKSPSVATDRISVGSSSISSFPSEDRQFLHQIMQDLSLRNNNGFRKKCKHFSKLLIFQFVPLIVLILFSAVFLVETQGQLEAATVIQHHVRVHQLTSDLVVALQIERGLSATYLSSQRSDPNVLKDLTTMRINSDAAANSLAWPFDGLHVPDVGHFKTVDDFKISLSNHRKQVVNHKGNTSVEHNIRFYTLINNALMLSSTQDILDLDQQKLWSKNVAKDNLLQSSDLLGIKRALGGVHYASCRLSTENLAWFLKVSSQGEILLEQAFNYHKPLRREWENRMLDNTLAVETVEQMNKEITHNVDACEKYGTGQAARQSLEWFWNISYFINTIAVIRSEIGSKINADAEKFIEEAQLNVRVQILVVCVIVCGCLVLGTYYSRQSYKIVTTIGNYAQQLKERKNELSIEKKVSDHLLYQMLPRSVAKQLKSGQSVPAVNFRQVTVCFSDIVDFTEMTATITPMDVVNMLNKLYW